MVALSTQSGIASQGMALHLAAAYYAAMLWPDPMRQRHPDPDQADKYLEMGRLLLTTLVKPEHLSVVRCHQSDDIARRVEAKALATVHDGRLVVFQTRGSVKWSTQMNRVSVVDLNMAQAGDHRSILTWCSTCGDGHDLVAQERTPQRRLEPNFPRPCHLAYRPT